MRWAFFAVGLFPSISLSVRLSGPSVCLSVCTRLSVCHVRVLYPATADDIVKLLSRPCSQIILVFDPCLDIQFQEEPLQRVRLIEGGFAIFA